MPDDPLPDDALPDSAPATLAPGDAAESKLTRSKERWTREGKLLTGRASRPETERLPPGQHLVKDWPVLDLGAEPRVDPDRWRLDVTGAVRHPLSLDFAGFKRLGEVRQVSDIHCVTTWSRYDNRWDGVPTRTLIEATEPEPDADFVVLHGADGYTTNLTLSDFCAEDALLATRWNGAPLTRDHGGPVRVVVPHLYFWKSAKWVQRIEVMRHNHPGFWEVRGYHDRGDPWVEQRYSD